MTWLVWVGSATASTPRGSTPPWSSPRAGTAPAEAARVLAGRFGVSVRQARRYVDDAGHGRVEIPDRAVAFTVKLPEGLVGRVRAYAAEHRLAISAVVAAALVEFLARDRGGRPER